MLIPTGEGYSRFNGQSLEKTLKKVVFEYTQSDDIPPLADNGDDICSVFVLSTCGKDAGPIKLFRNWGIAWYQRSEETEEGRKMILPAIRPRC